MMFTLDIIVAYASSDTTTLIPITVQKGTTIGEAISLSAIQIEHPEIDLDIQRVGIFGELKDLSDEVKAGDRIEIYRPLKKNPVDARMERTKKERLLKRRLRLERRKSDPA